MGLCGNFAEMSASDGSEHDGEDSDADLQALCGTEADGISKDKPRAPLEQNDGSNDPLLSEIAEDFLNAGIFLSYCYGSLRFLAERMKHQPFPKL